MRRAVLIFVAATATSAGARAQQASDGPPPAGPQSLPNQSQTSSPPVTPQAASRPPGWVGGPAAGSPAAISPEEAVAPWRTEKLPEQFTGTEIIARVGSEVILAAEVLPGVEETIKRAVAANQVQESQVKTLRYQLMMQRLEQLMDTKMLLIEARREIPKENLEKIRKKVKDIYEKEQIPKLIDGKKVKSRAELIKAMREAGTSLEEQERQFFERSLAAQYVHKQIGEEKEVTHAEMLEYYREHLKDYETAPRVRWEHIMVRFSNYPSKAEAYAKIANWGNEVLSGIPFSEVARKHSDDLSSEDGGMHDWTTGGSLTSEVLNQAIFSLPVNQLSPIIEDQRGFHIVRAVERQELTRKRFDEVQSEIKKKIKADREGAATNAYIAQLRTKIKAWTVFDELAGRDEKASNTIRR